MTTTKKLYEDSTGGLTIIHGRDIYTGIEQVTDATFSQLAAILRGELDGDMAIPDSEQLKRFFRNLGKNNDA